MCLDFKIVFEAWSVKESNRFKYFDLILDVGRLPCSLFCTADLSCFHPVRDMASSP